MLISNKTPYIQLITAIAVQRKGSKQKQQQQQPAQIPMMPYERKALSPDKKLSYSGQLMREFTSQLNMTIPLKVQRDCIRAMEGVSDPATSIIKEILK